MNAAPATIDVGATNEDHDRNKCRRDCQPIEAVEWRWQPSRIVTCQPIVGEARNDAATDQHQQHDNRAKTHASRILGKTAQVGFEMKRNIACGKDRHDGYKSQISPVLSGDDLADDQQHNSKQERSIDCGRQQPTDQARCRDSNAPGDPKQHQRSQRRSLERKASGPVRHRGEQESRHHGRQEAVEHLVHVPIARRKGGGQRGLTVENRQPDQQRHRPNRSRPAGKMAENRRKGWRGRRRRAVAESPWGTCPLA